MSSSSKFVHFTLEWKIQWSEFDSIAKATCLVRKDFITAYNNIPLRWYVEIHENKDEKTKFSFYVFYVAGPLEKIADVEYEVIVVKPPGDVANPKRISSDAYEAERGSGRGWKSFEDSDSTAFRTKCGLTEADRLELQITVKIPVAAFSYSMSIPPTPKPSSSATCLVDLFDAINDSSNPNFSDAKLISGDDVEFYCHKGLIAVQSAPLATMLRDPLSSQIDLGEPIDHPTNDRDQPIDHPPATEEANNDASPTLRGPETDESSLLIDVEQPKSKKRKRGEYDFPTMAAASLRSMIEYLYTGQTTMANLSVSELIEVADAAEQYALGTLKKWCSGELWKRVVDEPRMAFQIARFADLHEDMKWLKDRAFDVIVENWDGTTRDPADRFGGTRREELRREFIDYTAYRLRPYFRL